MCRDRARRHVAAPTVAEPEVHGETGAVRWWAPELAVAEANRETVTRQPVRMLDRRACPPVGHRSTPRSVVEGDMPIVGCRGAGADELRAPFPLDRRIGVAAFAHHYFGSGSAHVAATHSTVDRSPCERAVLGTRKREQELGAAVRPLALDHARKPEGADVRTNQEVGGGRSPDRDRHDVAEHRRVGEFEVERRGVVTCPFQPGDERRRRVADKLIRRLDRRPHREVPRAGRHPSGGGHLVQGDHSGWVASGRKGGAYMSDHGDRLGTSGEAVGVVVGDVWRQGVTHGVDLKGDAVEFVAKPVSDRVDDTRSLLVLGPRRRASGDVADARPGSIGSDGQPTRRAEPLMHPMVDELRMAAQRPHLGRRGERRLVAEPVLGVRQFIADRGQRLGQHHEVIGREAVGPLRFECRCGVEHRPAHRPHVAGGVVDRWWRRQVVRAVGLGPLAVESRRAPSLETERHVVEVRVDAGVVDAEAMRNELAELCEFDPQSGSPVGVQP